ncbi:hypothetical protein MMC07_002233 [Pseudocyphellaria aurata]|nr:hypothetical protein [Pseudocyphellaria aurata]
MPHKSNDAASEECHHYTRLVQVPWDIRNYYHQRFSIFSRYDDGILMTDGAWYGVTPEPVAKYGTTASKNSRRLIYKNRRKTAEHVANASPTEKAILIDCFAGVGGNVIAFALSSRWKRVYAIERDPNVLECAKHNAEIYGVHDQISWYQGDCFEILMKELADIVNHSVIFASPPWGGPGYRSDPVFDLLGMQPYSINDLLNPFLSLTRDVVLYLPRTSDLRQVAARVQKDEKATVIHYCMEGASKAICAYFGNFHFAE